MIFDTHTHYNLEPFFASWQEYWSAAQTVGVEQSIVVGTDPETNARAVLIASQAPGLFAAVGLHPLDLGSWSANSLSDLETLAQSSPKVRAIGETGLDFTHLPTDSIKATQIKISQIQAFSAQLQLAKKLNLTCIIHCRQAQAEVLRVLENQALLPAIVLHCFSGTQPYLDRAVALDCYCSFAGNLTYPSSQELQELAARVPANRLLVETDSPFLPPQSKRGQTCEPKDIVETVQKLAEVRQLSSPELVQLTQQNARRCFQVSE